MVLKLMRADEVGRLSTSAHDVEVVKVPGGLTFRDRVEVTAISGIAAAIVNGTIRGTIALVKHFRKDEDAPTAPAPKTKAKPAE